MQCSSHPKMDLYPGAPDQFKSEDTGGYNVLQPTQPYSGRTNYDLDQYYREKVSTGNAYTCTYSPG